MRLRWLPVLVFAVAACAPSAGSSPPSDSLPPATFEDFATNACDAFEALFRAVGNPDTGSGSELSTQLDEAVTRGDPAEANRIAEAIIAELRRGQHAASVASAWEPGLAAMAELNDVLVAYESYVLAKQDLSTGSLTDPQGAFEEAGGVTSWQAMLNAAAAVVATRPDVPPVPCDGIPMGW
jgi:hypothetical protein